MKMHLINIKKNNTLRLNAVRLSYEIRDDVIFYKDLEKESYLCILKSLYDRMFKIVYDDINYLEYVQTHKKLIDLLYFYNLLKNLYKYIQHYLQCLTVNNYIFLFFLYIDNQLYSNLIIIKVR